MLFLIYHFSLLYFLAATHKIQESFENQNLVDSLFYKAIFFG